MLGRITRHQTTDQDLPDDPRAQPARLTGEKVAYTSEKHADMSLPLGTRLGPYEILRVLGAGGMGEVYRARDTKLGRDVALKILPPVFVGDPDRLARFEQEAQLLASLNHPYIGAIYGMEESRGLRALVLELIEGPTLAETIGDRPMDTAQILAIGEQIADALMAAHAKGITHRDVKPANIMLTARGDVKMLDFGLAKLAAQDVQAAHSEVTQLSITTPGVVMGTVRVHEPRASQRPEHGPPDRSVLARRRAVSDDDRAATVLRIDRHPDPRPDPPRAARRDGSLQ